MLGVIGYREENHDYNSLCMGMDMVVPFFIKRAIHHGEKNVINQAQTDRKSKFPCLETTKQS